jgi:Ca2+-binding EF-hand superfamily protein
VVGDVSVEPHIGPPSLATVLRSFRLKSPGIERWRDVADASEYKATFELVDVDGDGFITAAEFKSLMRALGQEITDARAVEVVVSGDRNRDGKISLEEFADFMAAGGTLAG